MIENWHEFDGWCCINGIDPLELSAYRFHNLALYRLKEGMEVEQLAQLEIALEQCDDIKNPLHEFNIPKYQKKTIKSTPTQQQQPPSPKPPRQEIRHKYIPPWWKGEEANAKIALNTMDNLPK